MFKSQWAVQPQHLMPQFGFNKPRLLLYCGMENEIRGRLPAFLFLVIASHRRWRGDLICRAYARALFTGLLRFTRNDKRVWSLFVSCHRERAQRPWRSSYNRVAHTRVHYLLDCFAALAMTRECGRYSFHVIAREQRDRGDPVIIESRICARIIYWIASFHSQ